MNTSLDLHVFLSEASDPASLALQFPLFVKESFTFGDSFDDTVKIDVPIVGSDFVASNSTLYAHFFLNEAGRPWVPSDKEYNPLHAYVASKAITSHVAGPKRAVKKHLLGSADETEQVEEEEIPEVELAPTPHFHPNVTFGLVQFFMPLQYDPTMTWFSNNFDRVATNGSSYYPAVYNNKFWQLDKQQIKINATTNVLPLNIEIYSMSAWKFQLYAGIDEQKKQGMNGAAGEMDKVKEILLDSNPYLLGVTMIVSLLHTVFEMLAFKNDISHWRQKKDTIGVSVRSIIANVVMQTIIFLYLLDNNDDTSFMIMFGQLSGIAIEAWKITKVVDIKFVNGRLVVTDKHQLTEIEQKTKEYDEEIFKYMYIGSVPLVLAYAGYALVYLTHKSWYSFIISTLVGSVYAYGFLMLVPSIYINYKLKSVAHMPRKAMIYKFLNTFIDDLFAFVIKMPLLHRLATLRDDVIFIIYLYQTWLYKVDYSRVNEFGQGGEEEEEEGEEAKEKKDEPETLKEKKNK